jgi:copper transport protein
LDERRLAPRAPLVTPPLPLGEGIGDEVHHPRALYARPRTPSTLRTGSYNSNMMTTRRLVSLVSLCVLLLVPALVFPPGAAAHAALLQSDPAAGGSLATSPDAITLWFSEAVELRYSRVAVLRADGSRVATGDLHLLPDGADHAVRLPLRGDLPRGSYTVVWSVLSAVDGHVTEGFLSFVVGDALLPTSASEAALARQALTMQGVPSGVAAAVRWLNLLGQAVVAGTLVFLVVVLLPALHGGRIIARRYRRLLGGALALLLLGHLLAALVQAVSASGLGLRGVLGRPLVDLLTDTRYGALWLARLAILDALCLAVWALTRQERLPALRGRGRLLWGLTLGCAALLLLTTSLGSHAAARAGTVTWQVANDWLHLAGTAVWVGGLVALVLALRGSVLSQRADIRLRVLARFSALAGGAVAVLAVTGILAARQSVGGWEGLTTTDYGTWFLLKLAVVVTTVGLGAYHLLVVRPALALDPTPGTPLARRFGRSLRLEAALALAVLAISAVLTITVPGRDLLDRSGEPFAVSRLTPEMSVTLRMTPGQVGLNTFSVALSPLDLDTFGEVQRVYLRFTPAAHVTGSERVQLRQAGPGDSFTFNGTGAWLALEGEWDVTAIVRRSGVPDLEVPFDLVASRAGVRPAGLPEPHQAERDRPPVTLLGGLWLGASAALAGGGWRVRRYAALLSNGLLALAVLALVVGTFLLIAGGPGVA